MGEAEDVGAADVCPNGSYTTIEMEVQTRHLRLWRKNIFTQSPPLPPGEQSPCGPTAAARAWSGTKWGAAPGTCLCL